METSTRLDDEAPLPDTVPVRFRREVLQHLFANLAPVPGRSVPLILGVHGPSGEGKTYQCARVLEEAGVEAALVSGGELESVEAGRPAEMVRERYLGCAQRRAEDAPALAALVFNDIDAAIGSWGDLVQYTVNRQNVFGELMHLADFPESVDGSRVPRVPIIITGNDFSKLYGPLVRPGRMRLFAWIPTSQEKAQVVAAVFPGLRAGERLTLVEKFAGQPVAFFAQLRGRLEDDQLWQIIEQTGVAEAFARLARGEQPRLSTRLDLEALLEAGEGLLRSGEVRNHLGS